MYNVYGNRVLGPQNSSIVIKIYEHLNDCDIIILMEVDICANNLFVVPTALIKHRKIILNIFNS